MLIEKICRSKRPVRTTCCLSTAPAAVAPSTQVRASDLVAATAMIVYTLTRAKFNELLGPYEDVWRFEALKKVGRTLHCAAHVTNMLHDHNHMPVVHVFWLLSKNCAQPPPSLLAALAVVAQ